jgi:hypothetical protein
MIPAGYVESLVAWATRPDLSSEEMASRKQQLLDAHDALVTGQVGSKPSRTLIAGSMNGKNFSWAADMSTAEKMTAITAVLRSLCLLAPEDPSITYGNFQYLRR